MKVTIELIEYIAAYIQRHDSSYEKIAAAAGMSWQNVQKIMDGKRHELRDSSVAGLSKALAISEQELRGIADGELPGENAKHDGISRKATALWRWLRHDIRRCDALRLMGFKGDLPR